MEDARKQILIRVYVLYFILLMAGLAVIGKLVYLQVVEGDELREKARQSTMAYHSVEAARGSVYDGNGMLLATSVPLFDIRMDVASPLIDDELFHGKVDSLAHALANLFKDRHHRNYRSDLISNRNAGNRYMLIKRNATYTELKVVRNMPILRRGKYRGGLIEVPRSRRVKPFRQLASRTIGYARPGYKVGLEGAYDQVLRGDSGKHLMRRVASNVWIPVDQGLLVEPKNGYDIITTLDVNIQDVAQSALEENLRRHQAAHGCAVLMEVATGEIKAIANLKRDTATGQYHEAYNYAVGASTEPGSTFKTASLMVALEHGKFNVNDSVDTRDGRMKFYGQEMVDAQERGHGRITIARGLEISSNVAISKMIHEAYVTQPEKFSQGLQKLGLHKPLGLEIAGEGKPLIKSPGHPTWSRVTLPWMSIGYEVRMTPLQILAFYNGIANNGRMMKPMFVKEIRSAGQTVERIEPQVLNPALASRENIKKVQEILVNVVEEGTAKNLFNTVYTIAGKTGTAQIAMGSEGYVESGHVASFVGYFPADNPRYSCIVVINKPARGSYYGSAVAAPVFKEIADKVYATQLDIHEEKVDTARSVNIDLIAGYQQDIQGMASFLSYSVNGATAAARFVSPVAEPSGIRVAPRHFRSGVVPDVRGMGARDAVYLMRRQGLRVQVKGRGVVTRQSVRPGTPVVREREIILELNV